MHFVYGRQPHEGRPIIIGPLKPRVACDPPNSRPSWRFAASGAQCGPSAEEVGAGGSLGVEERRLKSARR